MTDVLRFEGGPFAENTYLVISGGRATLVDPGWATPRALRAVEDRGLPLDAVLLTHAHIDHVEGLPLLADHAPLPVRLHPDDLPLYHAAPAQAAAFGVELGTLPTVQTDLHHGQVLTLPGELELHVRHVPGHAPGHVLFHAPAEQWALVGDVVFLGSIGRTDLPGGDFHTLMASIRREVLGLPDDTRLLPGHGPETTVRHERVSNPFLIPQYGGERA
ncbi:MAG: MBL fold metallo-hydrolase [Gemmatimonadota bacterium]